MSAPLSISLDPLLACAERAEARLLAWFDKNPEPAIGEINSASQALWRLTAVRKTLALLATSEMFPRAKTEEELRLEEETFQREFKEFVEYDERMNSSKSKGAYPEVYDENLYKTLPPHYGSPPGNALLNVSTPSSSDALPPPPHTLDQSESNNAEPEAEASSPTPPIAPAHASVSPSPFSNSASSNPKFESDPPEQSQISNLESQIHLAKSPFKSFTLRTPPSVTTFSTSPRPRISEALRLPSFAPPLAVPTCRLIGVHCFRTIHSTLNRIIGRFSTRKAANAPSCSKASKPRPSPIKILLNGLATCLPKIPIRSVRTGYSVHGPPAWT